MNTFDKQDFQSLLTGYWLTDLANTSSYLFHHSPNLNWVGFYLYQMDRLKLGPFIGKPACTEIKVGRGVCGIAFLNESIMNIPNVDEFADHIRCDTETKSELVIPIVKNGVRFGVFDIDSNVTNRFSSAEVSMAEEIIQLLCTQNFSKQLWAYGFGKK